MSAFRIRSIRKTFFQSIFWNAVLVSFPPECFPAAPFFIVKPKKQKFYSYGSENYYMRCCKNCFLDVFHPVQLKRWRTR